MEQWQIYLEVKQFILCTIFSLYLEQPAHSRVAFRLRKDFFFYKISTESEKEEKDRHKNK